MAARYMLIGVERSSSKDLRRGTDTSRIPRHLLIDNISPADRRQLSGWGSGILDHNEYRDTISIADLKSISCKQAKVLRIPSKSLNDFEQQYNVEPHSKNLDKYGSTNISSPQPMVILKKIGNIGCQCMDVNGQILNVSNADILRYANTFGIANAKVYEKIGLNSDSLVISGIGWNIPTITMEEANQIKNKVNTAPQRTNEQKLDLYIKKANLLGIDALPYEIDLDTSTIVKCKPGTYKKLILPPVKTIGWDAFKGVNAEEIVIPQTVESIGPRAFDECNVTKLTVLGHINKIGKAAFSPYTIIRTLYLGDNYNGNNLLTRMRVCQIRYIEVSSNNNLYEVKDNVLYTKGLKELLLYPRLYNQEVYTIPNTVSGNLESATFYKVNALKKLELSDNITGLEKNSIVDCPNLISITFGRRLSSIENGAMKNLEGLKRITVQSNIIVDTRKHIIRTEYGDVIDEEAKVGIIYSGVVPKEVSDSISEADKIIDDYCRKQGWN